jgi:hypothetical protein
MIKNAFQGAPASTGLQVKHHAEKKEGRPPALTDSNPDCGIFALLVLFSSAA